MDKKVVNEDKISKNFIFFDFRDFSFHNYGQMFPKWNKDKLCNAKEEEDDTSLNCSPDTDAAIQDALEEIIRDLSGEKIEESDIKLFDDAGNNFKKFTSWLSVKKKINEYEKYIKKNIKNFASKKHKESDELCNKVFESLFNPANFRKFQENIKERITYFLEKEGISDNNTNEKKYILKYLNVLLRTIPQPWNALASGAILTFIMKRAQGEEAIDNKFIKYEYPAIYIENMWECIKHMSNTENSGNELPPEYAKIVKDIQFYLEYALIINTPGKWEPTDTGRNQVSMIAFPLLDNGFFRGYFYLLSSLELIEKKWDDPNIVKQIVKQNKEKCLYFVDSLRVAHETEMMDILFREKKGGDEGKEDKEEDIYKRILKNLHYVQEISLGSLWMVNGNSPNQSYVTGYGRDFKEKTENDKNPGIYLYKGYEGYEAFFKAKNSEANSECNIKKEEEKLARELNKLFCNSKDKEEFYGNYPKCVSFKNNFNSEWIRASSEGSYYNQSSLDIKWRLTLPVVRGDDLKAIFFLYYRDPIVMYADKFTLLTNVQDENMQKSLRKEIFGLRARQIMKFFSAIEAYEERKIEIIKHGTRAAVAAIMGRNMSHNLGSHVLSYWKGDLEREDLQLCDFFTRFSCGSTNEEDVNLGLNFGKEDAAKKENNNCLEKSYQLFDYLKNRMDFIAEITTTTPSWEKTLTLKEEIIDPFLKHRAILDNLIKSEGFCFFKVIEECDKRESNNISNYKCSNCSRYKNIKTNLDDEPEPFRVLYVGEDFPVSIPHGIIGTHAIYSILENFIRNSAKHGGRRVRNRLKKQRGNGDDYFKIIIQAEDKGDYVSVTISDNVGNCNTKVKTSKGEKKRIIDLLNDAIQDSKYVDNEGRLLKGNWGIKEIKLSANFLRMKNTDTLVYSTKIDEDQKKYPHVQLGCYEDNCKENRNCTLSSGKNIAYTFYLRKPKEAFIVYGKEDDPGIKEILSEKNEHKKYGIDVTNFDDFKSILERGENIPHRFIIFLTSELFGKYCMLKKNNASYMELYSTRLPGRVIVNSNGKEEKKSINASIKKEVKTSVYTNSLIEYKYDEFMKDVYEKYVKSKFGNSTKIFFLSSNSASGWTDTSICFTNIKLSNDSIVFDNHGTNYNKRIITNYSYYHPFGTTIGFTFNNFISRTPKTEVKKKIAHYELIEMAKVKVVIADERIYKNYAGKKVAVNPETKPDIIELMKEKMGVSIVSVPADTVNEEEILSDVNRGHFLVIHQGLIEKMSDKKKFLRQAKEKYDYIVIDSGRGVPEELEEGTLYMEIGALERFIGELDKYSLIQTLYSLRRPKNA